MSNPEEAYNTLSNFVNNYNCDREAFIKAFLKDHNTLQQSVLKLLFQLMEEFAKQEHSIDLRNQKSQELCKMITKYYEEETGYKLSESIPHI